MYLEIVASGEANRQYWTVEEEDSPVDGLVYAVWMEMDNQPSFWVQVDGPAPGSMAQRPFLLGATLRQMGVNCHPRQGDKFDYKAFSDGAWSYWLEEGFAI